MKYYVLKRLLWFIPTLLLLSWVAFRLSRLTPGDPVELYLKNGASDNSLLTERDFIRQENDYKEAAQKLGFNKPAFYITFTTAAHPDTLYRILHRQHRQTANQFINHYGNWYEIQDYFNTILAAQKLLSTLPDTLAKNQQIVLNKALRQLQTTHEEEKITEYFEKITTALQEDTRLYPIFSTSLEAIKQKYDHIKKTTTPYKLYIPTLHWHGFDNQYHHWLSSFLKGDFGLSYRDQRPVSATLFDALKWTLVVNVLTIILAYLVSIPLGVLLARYKNAWWNASANTLLYIIHSIPLFWVGTLAVLFFTTNEYQMPIFESIGLGEITSNMSLGEQLQEAFPHLILPILCLFYASLSFITLQMRNSMMRVLQQDFIRTARAKGLTERQVVWKHALRNALFPVVTLFASVFPAAISGSVIIEVIFDIPGMGKLMSEAIPAQNWPVVYAVLMLAAVLALIGNLLADLLYAVLDPRVSFEK